MAEKEKEKDDDELEVQEQTDDVETNRLKSAFHYTVGRICDAAGMLFILSLYNFWI